MHVIDLLTPSRTLNWDHLVLSNIYWITMKKRTLNKEDAEYKCTEWRYTILDLREKLSESCPWKPDIWLLQSFTAPWIGHIKLTSVWNIGIHKFSSTTYFWPKRHSELTTDYVLSHKISILYLKCFIHIFKPFFRYTKSDSNCIVANIAGGRPHYRTYSGVAGKKLNENLKTKLRKAKRYTWVLFTCKNFVTIHVGRSHTFSCKRDKVEHICNIAILLECMNHYPIIRFRFFSFS